MEWWIKKCLKALVFLTLSFGLLSWLVMHLWNWLMPDLFESPRINWMQALGLLLLSRLLVGSWSSFWKLTPKEQGQKKAYWRKKWEAKLEKMPPEKREKWKQHWEMHCSQKEKPPESETISNP